MQACDTVTQIDELLYIEQRADDYKVLIIKASVMLYPDDEMFDALNGRSADWCYTLEHNVTFKDNTMAFGKARLVHVRFHDQCPDGEHSCRFTERTPLSEYWEEGNSAGT